MTLIHSLNLNLYEKLNKNSFKLSIYHFQKTFHFHFPQVIANFKVQFLLTPLDW